MSRLGDSLMVWRQNVLVCSNLARVRVGSARLDAREQEESDGKGSGANGDNRIAIVIPCHRVVASDGELTGYGGGLWRKQYLLALEQAQGFHLT
jgi:O-6-methylguanine DNA methyltransferase